MSRAASKPALDLEALRRLDVLELDGAERRRDGLDGANDLFGVLAVDQDGHAVDADQGIEEHRLALHDGQACHRADVAQAQNRRAVGDDGDRVADRGVLVAQLGILLDQPAHLGHAGRVELADGGQAVDRKAALDLNLAAPVQLEHRVDDLGDDHALDLADLRQHQLEVRLVVEKHRDIARVVLEAVRDQVGVGDVAARVAHRGGDPPEVPRLVENQNANGFDYLVGALLDLHHGGPAPALSAICLPPVPGNTRCLTGGPLRKPGSQEVLWAARDNDTLQPRAGPTGAARPRCRDT